MDPAFSRARPSLLDRGFAFAVAHIRGGQELGRAWYEAGRQERKANTFRDFIACARHLRKRRMCDPDRMFAMGGSAGGLLMGAVLNEEPDLFAGMVAIVPFVDVLNTMLDPDIPLTTAEYDEWGDPNRKEFFELMASYAPYENIPEARLPHILVTSGLHDSQVQFWEPTKWVQRLRERQHRPGRPDPPAHEPRRRPRRPLGALPRTRGDRGDLRVPHRARRRVAAVPTATTSRVQTDVVFQPPRRKTRVLTTAERE